MASSLGLHPAARRHRHRRIVGPQTAGVDLSKAVIAERGRGRRGWGKPMTAGAARREERIAAGELQLRQSLPPGGLRFDLAGLRQPASSACASAISGISGVGAKPSSAGARTAWASAGRAVDR